MSTALDPAIEDWLQPLERFEALRASVLPSGRVLDLAYPNVPEPPHPRVREALVEVLYGDGVQLQYTPYGGMTITRRLIARALGESHGQPFHWRHIVLTPGAMAALNVLFRALVTPAGPGEVIVVTPCWMDYPLYLANLGLVPVFAPVDPDTLRLDVDRIRSALSERTRAIVLSQPANPTGVLHSGQELRELAKALESCPAAVRPVLIADECHRDYVFDDVPFVSPMDHYPDCCIVYSFGKGLQIQGQRLGYVAVSPQMRDAESFCTRLERLCRLMGFCTPTALMQLAVRRLLDFRPSLAALAAKRAQVLLALAAAGYRVVPSAATWFLYPWTPGGDGAFVEHLAALGVLVLPSEVFWHTGHFRIALTASERDIEAALPKLRQVAVR